MISELLLWHLENMKTVWFHGQKNRGECEKTEPRQFGINNPNLGYQKENQINKGKHTKKPPKPTKQIFFKNQQTDQRRKQTNKKKTPKLLPGQFVQVLEQDQRAA